jgi:hypothetical protein
LVRSLNKVILPTAWTGIAASLLVGGQTCHSRFALPVPFTNESCSLLRVQSPEANYIRKARVILCDEASMMPGHFLIELDRLLRDLMNENRPFGNKIVLLGGDFCQTLPVSPRALRIEKIAASINKTVLWNLFEHFKLNVNMRVNPNEVEFVDWLQKLGNGLLPGYKGLPKYTVRLPNECLIRVENREPTEEDLINFVFNNSNQNDVFDNQSASNRAILCPLNEDTLRINELILDKIQGKINKVLFKNYNIALQCIVFFKANRVNTSELIQ